MVSWTHDKKNNTGGKFVIWLIENPKRKPKMDVADRVIGVINDECMIFI